MVDRENPFLETFHDAMIQIIDSTDYHDVLARFLSTYQYRKQFAWLQESNGSMIENDQEGLYHALRFALATYSNSKKGILLEPSSSQYQPVTAEWKDNLRFATQKVIQERFSLERFYRRLQRYGFTIDNLTTSDLQYYIALALETYHADQNKGLSPDPF